MIGPPGRYSSVAIPPAVNFPQGRSIVVGGVCVIGQTVGPLPQQACRPARSAGERAAT